jgi:hypothetical protein
VRLDDIPLKWVVGSRLPQDGHVARAGTTTLGAGYRDAAAAALPAVLATRQFRHQNPPLIRGDDEPFHIRRYTGSELVAADEWVALRDGMPDRLGAAACRPG